jgi:hypothetical protein
LRSLIVILALWAGQALIVVGIVHQTFLAELVVSNSIST